MATKRKTRVSATTKKALNDLRKDRAVRQAAIAEARTNQILTAQAAIRDREYNTRQIPNLKSAAAALKAEANFRRSAVESIRMGAHSRRVKDTKGRPIEIEVRFSASDSSLTLSGWNSFDKIYVGVGRDLFRAATAMINYRFVNKDLTDQLMDAVIGIGYHEIGHSIHSPNYEDVLDICRANHPTQYSEAGWHTALNVLDDQRMETAMAIWSPNLARSFTSMVNLAIVHPVVDGLGQLSPKPTPNRFPLLHGRFYLPKEIRQQAREDYVADFTEDVADAVAAAIDSFIGASTNAEMAQAVADYVEATAPQVARVGMSQPSGMNYGEYGTGGDDLLDQPVDAGASEEELAADAEAIGEARQSMESGTFQSETQGVSRQAKAMADDYLRSVSSSQVTSDVSAPTELMSDEDHAKAEKLGRDIAQRLRTSAAGNAHRWTDRTATGVVNGFRYRTRPSRADMNFHRAEQGSSSLGFDLDVTVLLDMSTSMNDVMDEVSIVGHAIKQACDELGSNCTVGLFSESYTVLYQSDARASGIQVESGGCTDPLRAFEDIENHRSHVRHEKPQLVIVMTDGEFNRHIAPYQADNQHWIGVALDTNDSEERLVQALDTNGFEEIHVITDTLEVAEILENWLHDTVVPA